MGLISKAFALVAVRRTREIRTFTIASPTRWAQDIYRGEHDTDSSPDYRVIHGFPTSSYVFRDLVSQLAGPRYHLIAPDHLGFGLSDAPSVDKFEYSFDALAEIVRRAVKAARDRPVWALRSEIPARPSGGVWRCAPRRRSPRSSLRTAMPTELGLIKEFLGADHGLHERMQMRKRKKERDGI